MTHVFSPSKLAFYPTEQKEHYERAGSWPADPEPVSDATWKAHVGFAPQGKTLGSKGGQPAWLDKPAETLTDQQQARQALRHPAVKVEGSSKITGVYKVDDKARIQIISIVSAINAGLGLPSGTDTFLYFDDADKPHAWTAKQFVAFAHAVMIYRYALEQVAQGRGTMPSNVITISG